MRFYKDIDGRRTWFNGLMATDGKIVINPTVEMLKENGWTEYVQKPMEETQMYTREQYIRVLIAEKYAVEDELALINNYLSDRETYGKEYEEYQNFRQDCKLRANALYHEED